MRLLILIMFLALIYLVSGKTNVKTLTESLGQEVIEIAAPIKELPMGIEEEPATEKDDDDDDDDEKPSTHSTLPTTIKKEVKRPTAEVTLRSAMEKFEGLTTDDEEARIEKELAELYKDNSDYKTDSAEEKEVTKDETEVVKQPPKETVLEEFTSSAEESDKPIGRQGKNSFKFQPDTTDKAAVERFRTSVDVINCNSKQKLSNTVDEIKTIKDPDAQNGAFETVNHGIILLTAVLCYIFICS